MWWIGWKLSECLHNYNLCLQSHRQTDNQTHHRQYLYVICIYECNIRFYIDFWVFFWLWLIALILMMIDDVTNMFNNRDDDSLPFFIHKSNETDTDCSFTYFLTSSYSFIDWQIDQAGNQKDYLLVIFVLFFTLILYIICSS